MIDSKIFLFLCLLTILNLSKCSVEESAELDLIIDAQLLNARLVNYHNQFYSKKPAWLEYNIVLTNNKDQVLDLCTYQVYLVIKSDKIGFIDSLEVSWGKGKMMPREKDTLTVVDYFINKSERISVENWVNPNEMEYKCFGSNMSNLIKDVAPINSFRIVKSKDFEFKIE